MKKKWLASEFRFVLSFGPVRVCSVYGLRCPTMMCVSSISLYRQSLWNNVRKVLCAKRNEKDEKRIRQSAFIVPCNGKYRLHTYIHILQTPRGRMGVGRMRHGFQYLFFASIMHTVQHAAYRMIYLLYTSTRLLSPCSCMPLTKPLAAKRLI